MLEKEFVPYEWAVKLKELGFDEPCFMFYEQETSSKYLQKGIDDEYWGDYSEPRDWNSIPNKPWKPFCKCVSAPLYQQAFRWLLNRHNLYGIIIPTETMNWTFKTMTVVKDMIEVPPYNHVDANDYSTHEEAELACIKKLIEIVENNSKNL